MGPMTYALVGLLATFLGLDGVAHFTKYKYGETFSALVWATEKKYPPTRVGFAIATLILFTHLVFHVP